MRSQVASMYGPLTDQSWRGGGDESGTTESCPEEEGLHYCHQATANELLSRVLEGKAIKPSKEPPPPDLHHVEPHGGGGGGGGAQQVRWHPPKNVYNLHIRRAHLPPTTSSHGGASGTSSVQCWDQQYTISGHVVRCCDAQQCCQRFLVCL